MRSIRLTLAATIALCAPLLACTSHDVVVTHATSPATPLTSYQRYHLVITPPSEASRTHWMVEAAVHDDLRRKGYVPVDRGSADLLVTYDTDISTGDGRGVRQAIDGSIAARPTTSKHLTILMTDARSGQPVWRGDARGDVKAGRLTASVAEALDELLAPVPARSAPPPSVAVQ